MNPLLRARATVDRLRTSLWFLPSVAVVSTVVLARLLVEVEVPGDTWLKELVFGGGPEGARQLLTTIAGAMITVTGTVFTLTIVVLQLASTQYSPRLLRSFLRDRSNQVVLSTFIGTFAYAIATLRTIRAAAEDPGREEMVPSLAISVAVLLSFAAVAALVYFINHVAQSIRIETIVHDVHKETSRLIDKLYEEPLEAGDEGQELSDPPGRAVRVPARGSGHVQAFDLDRLLAVAEEHGLVVQMSVYVGSYVVRGATIAWVWTLVRDEPAPDGEKLALAIGGGIAIGHERTMQQDAAFGLRQLADIPLRAMSPSVNDPTTAVQALGPVSALLVQLAGRRLAPAVCEDATGRVRVAVPRPAFEDFLALSVDQIRRFAASEPVVIRRVLQLLHDAAFAAPTQQRRDVVRAHVERVIADAEREIQNPDDVDLVRAEAERALEAVRGRPQPGGDRPTN